MQDCKYVMLHKELGRKAWGGGVGWGEYRMQVLHKLEARGGEGCQ